MKYLAVVTSPQTVEWSSLWHCMVLAHLVKHEMGQPSTAVKYTPYTMFYRQRSQNGAWVLMDNGAAENGFPMSITELDAVRKIINPSVIVVPDYPNVFDATYEMAKACVPHMRDWGSLMLVPQGANLAEWTQSLLYLTGPTITKDLDMTKPQWLGISKFTMRWGGPDIRLQLLETLQTLGLHRRFNVHLLGLENPAELGQVRQAFSWVAGCDTSLPLAMAIKGYNTTEYDKIGKIEMDFNWTKHATWDDADASGITDHEDFTFNVEYNVSHLRELMGLPPTESQSDLQYDFGWLTNG